MARSPSRTLQLTYLGDASQLRRTNDAAASNVSAFGDRVKTFGKVAAGAFLAVGAAGIKLGQELFNAFEEANTANARVENLVNQLGNFEGQVDKVTGRLIEQAEATARLTGVDRNLIKESQGILLTFASINSTADTTGGVFDRATQAAVDLSAAGFGSVDSAAVQLGKALEDPVRGLTALRRSGVTFTAEQEELIKSLVESNNVLEAQTLILEAIEGQVGGTAEATANGSDRIAQSFGLLKERIGGQLQPVFDLLVAKALEFVDRFGVWWDENGDDVIQSFRDFAGSVRDTYESFREFVGLVNAELTERGVWADLRREFVTLRDQFNDTKDALESLLDTLFGSETEDKVSGFATLFEFFVIGPINRARDTLDGFLSTLEALFAGLESLARVVQSVRDAEPESLLELGAALGRSLIVESLRREALRRGREAEAERERQQRLDDLERGGTADRPVIPRPGALAPGVTININAPTDPEGAARSVERIINGSARRVGGATLGVLV